MKTRTYKGIEINKLFPSGYYEAYIIDRFYRADTLKGIKSIINTKLKEDDNN